MQARLGRAHASEEVVLAACCALWCFSNSEHSCQGAVTIGLRAGSPPAISTNKSNKCKAEQTKEQGRFEAEEVQHLWRVLGAF